MLSENEEVEEEVKPDPAMIEKMKSFRWAAGMNMVKCIDKEGGYVVEFSLERALWEDYIDYLIKKEPRRYWESVYDVFERHGPAKAEECERILIEIALSNLIFDYLKKRNALKRYFEGKTYPLPELARKYGMTVEELEDFLKPAKARHRKHRQESSASNG